MKELAQLKIDGFNETIKSPLSPGLTSVAAIINRVVAEFLVPIAAVILFFVFLWGGYDFLFSGGSPDKIKSGRAKITAGLIGFVFIIISYVLVRVIAYVFNLGSGVLGP